MKSSLLLLSLLVLLLFFFFSASSSATGSSCQGDATTDCSVELTTDKLSPLLAALAGDRADDVRDYLLEAGLPTNVGFPDYSLRSLLHLACDHGAISVAEYLLADPATNVRQSDVMGRSAIWHCTNLGQLEILRVAVAFGHDLGLDQEAQDDRGVSLTPVNLARRNTQITSGAERSRHLEIAFLWLAMAESPHDSHFLSILRREVHARSKFGSPSFGTPFAPARHPSSPPPPPNHAGPAGPAGTGTTGSPSCAATCGSGQ